MEHRAKELRELLTYYQRAYYTTGRSLVSDLEYDRLFDELVRIEEQHPELKTEDSPTQRVGSDLSSDFPEVQHSIPVLSLDKAYSDKEILNYIEKTIKNTNQDLSFALEEKIDGFSIVLYYTDGILQKAVTRGNGEIGNDVTANVKTIHSVPLKLTKPVNIAVRGEIYLPKADFERINQTLSEPYANPRNLAAGTIRRIKSSETAKVPLTIFCYEGFWEDSQPFSDHIQILQELKELGFCVDDHFSFFCKTKEEAQERLKQANLNGKALSFEDIEQEIVNRTEQRKTLDYDIDGLVVKVNEISVRDELGYTEHHPRWAIAYKFEAPQAQSVVEDIDVQIGRTGRVTPMARIHETRLSGSTIKNVTLHNQDYVFALELAKGDTVSISKRGDVIPAVENIIEKNTDGNTTWKMPALCPVCNSPIIKKGAHHFCSNSHCPAQEKGKLEFFCAKKQLDIEGFGPKIIEFLYDNDYVKSIGDLFRFDYKNLLRNQIEGFGEKKVQAMENAISNAKNATFEQILAGLGIPEFSHKAIELVISQGYDSIEKLMNISDPNDLSQIPGIGPVTANLIIQGLHDPQTLSTIKDLQELGFQLCKDDNPKTSQDNQNKIDQIFANQSWCITGTFQNFQPRDKAMAEIKKRGGKEVSAVSSKTTCLLAGANAGSKLAKAQQLGIKIISEQEFLAMIQQPQENLTTTKNQTEQPELF